MTEPQFTHSQIWQGLLPELGSAKFVLGTGLQLLQGGDFARDKDAIFATLAVGVEKIVKIALGLIEVGAGRPWPRMNLAREGWGHKTADMDARLRRQFRDRIDAGNFERAGFLRRLLCTIEEDPVWYQLVLALQTYGLEGRFYALDKIGGATQPNGDPSPIWDEAERHAIEASPELQSLQSTLDPSFETALNDALAASIKRWWTMVGLMGMHGVVGGEWGKVFGADILPTGGVAELQLDPGCP